MLAAFDKPDAKAPASMGAVGATVVMLTAIAARIEKCVNAVAEDQERQLSELRAKAAKVDDLEGRIKTFDPLVYTGRECGKRSITMNLADGRKVVVITEISSGSEPPATLQSRPLRD